MRISRPWRHPATTTHRQVRQPVRDLVPSDLLRFSGAAVDDFRGMAVAKERAWGSGGGEKGEKEMGWLDVRGKARASDAAQLPATPITSGAARANQAHPGLVAVSGRLVGL